MDSPTFSVRGSLSRLWWCRERRAEPGSPGYFWGKQRKEGRCWSHLCKSVKGWITFSQGITKLTTHTCTHTETHTCRCLCWRLKSLPNFWPCVSYFTFHHDWLKTHMFLKKLGRISILSLLKFHSHSADFTGLAICCSVFGPQQVVLFFILWIVWVMQLIDYIKYLLNTGHSTRYLTCVAQNSKSWDHHSHISGGGNKLRSFNDLD